MKYNELNSPLLKDYKRLSTSQTKRSKRPTRVLIALVDQLNIRFVKEISPRSVNLKRFIKAPMVFLIWSCATFAGQNLCFFKAFGEIITGHDFWNRPVMACFLAVLGGVGGLC